MNLTAKFELLLFISGEDGISLTDLASLNNTSKPAAEQQIQKLIEKYQTDDSTAFSIIQTADRYRLTSKEQFADFLKMYAKNPINQTISKSALEVLAIIAYKQPITRVEIDHIRGVNSSGTLSTLRTFNLVKKVGTLEAPGHPGLYATTDYFLDYIGVNSLEELPEVNEDDFIAERQVLFEQNDSSEAENENLDTLKSLMEEVSPSQQ